MEDQGIIDLFFKRSEQAIEETDKKYGGYCYSIAYSILSNRAFLTPIGNPEPKELPSLWNPRCVLKGIPTNGKWFVGIPFKTQKSPGHNPIRRSLGIFYTALIKRLRSFVCYAAQPPFICRRSIYSSLSSSPCEPQSRPADACRRDTRREPWFQPPDDRSCGIPTW